MPAAPVGPGQDRVGGLLHRQDHAPAAAAPLLNAQREPRPRPALNAVKRLRGCRGGRLWFHASSALAPARSTVSRANAPMARVLCRYHPVQLRTAS
jgi:hypothetical protein